MGKATASMSKIIDRKNGSRLLSSSSCELLDSQLFHDNSLNAPD